MLCSRIVQQNVTVVHVHMAGSFFAEIHCIMEHTMYGVTRPLGTVVDCQTFMTVQNLHSLCSRGITIHAPSHSLLAVLRKASYTSHDETVQFRRRCELDSRRLSYS